MLEDFEGDTAPMTEAMLHAHVIFDVLRNLVVLDEFHHKNGKMLQEIELGERMVGERMVASEEKFSDGDPQFEG